MEEASQKIAARRASDEYAIALSRLADIENKGTVPSIYRLYTLCAIYRLDIEEVLGWYGVPVGELPADALNVGIAATHAVRFCPAGQTPDLPPVRTSTWRRPCFWTTSPGIGANCRWPF